MLEEGSKPHPGRDGAFQPARRGPGLIASPWLPTAGAMAVASALGVAILAASAPGRFPELWLWLNDNYWLLAALSVFAILGCGKDAQLGAARDLGRLRITGDLITVLAADCALAA